MTHHKGRMIGLLLFAAACGPAVAGEPESLRQSFDMRVPVAPTPVPTGGERILLYELHLTNFSGDELVLETLEILAGRGGETMVAFGEEELERRVFGPAGDHPRSIPPGTTGVVYVETAAEPDAGTTQLLHRLTYTAADGSRSSRVQGAPTIVRSGPPLVLAPPVRGGPWAAVYSPSWTRGHRRVIYAVGGEATIPGRYAIDWFRLDDDGNRARGDEDAVANWLGYGTDVLAVADGTVVATRDDVAESTLISGHPDHSLADASGNYVAIDLGKGRIAFFEHLKPDSIRVQTGERVRQGQVIAAVGFTGSSAGPHLHFHIADANSPLGAEGLPFVLDEYVLLGRYEDFDRFGEVRWTPISEATDERRRNERPPPNSVVDFR